MTAQANGNLRSVALCDIPADAYIALHLHTDDLVRELELISLGHHSGSAIVPREEYELARNVLDHYRDQRQSAWEQADEARRSGRTTIDLELQLPVEGADAIEELAELFDRVEDLCCEGALLTVPLTPELRALRRWLTEELLRQVRQGAKPAYYGSD